jgi:tetratricopeptide (TPR) repeat protein
LKRIRSLIILALAVILGFSCSTKKNTFTRRAYHNLTAHYNAYFNGNEAFKEGVNTLAKTSKDNYNKILPVFQYGSKVEAQSQNHLFDRAIEKASIVIQRHSIYIKRVEHVKWIDDAYLLIGKSYLYKQDLELAAQTFAFIRERYKNNPIVYDAVLNQVRAYTLLNRFDDGKALIALVEKKIERKQSNRKIEKFFPLVMADYYLQQEAYGQAIEHLEAAYRLNKTKKIRTRVSFILAQVYQKTGNLGRATEYYQKNLGFNPVYEMAFASKINIARCYDAAAGDSRDIKKTLAKMLRDDKNKEFRDQIYYALAEVHLKERNDTAAIKNLRLSAQTSVSDDYQKGISYLKLGDIYYGYPEYKPAQMFYDSAVQFLPKDYPNYSLIESKKIVLTELVKNLTVIELEDSLQALGRLSHAERLARIDNIIAEIRNEEARKRQEEIDRQIHQMNLQQMSMQGQLNQPSGQWYFYNPQMISMGMVEFAGKWGNRKLEDLWRLSNKVVVEFGTEPDEEEIETDSVFADDSKAFDPKDRNAYLRSIPTTPEAFAKSDARIIEALFNVGVIYKDGLYDYEKSSQAFGTLFRRFPDNQYVLPSYYYLYRIYYETEEPYTAETYKNIILSKYPESDYARILKDPDYYRKIDSIGNLEDVFYQTVYQAFHNNRHQFVIQSADSAVRKFRDRDVIPKFAYLRALSIGRMSGDSLLLPALSDIVNKYQYSPVSKLAQDLIALRSGNGSAGKMAESTSDSVPKIPALTESPYVYDPNGFHFYIAVFEAVNVKIPEIKNHYSDHNSHTFRLEKLTVNSMFLDNTHQMITVNRFNNKEKAMDYYVSVNSNNTIKDKLGPANMRHFVVSANNYTTFYRLKNVQQYLDFFQIHYLNQ